MTLFLSGLAILLAGALASLLSGRRPLLASLFAAGTAVVGGLIAAIPAIGTLATGRTESLRLAWNVPYGSFSIQIDPLSALFLVTILGLSAVAAVYGVGYLWAFREKKNLGIPWFFYNGLVVAMALVVVARNGVLFLVAWEMMSLASYFLVTFEYEKQAVVRAGGIYLVATHIGTAFLLVFFIILGHYAGSLDFDNIGAIPAAPAGILFVLAVVGFGTKAGFMPLHVWLPHAHPAAPSHVSAVMSGVMIKTGIYGLIRTITLLGAPEAWWCWLLIGIGVTSGLLGVLFALAQQDLKRLLAYSSIENIGIIALGLGVGLLGVHIGAPTLAVFGFAGALFHVVNHALFKGLLFLGAGAILHGSKTTDMDLLGGLIKRMPWTAWTFLIGAAAISGLPPLNGFAGEFLIYLGLFKGGMSGGLDTTIPVVIAIGSLALIGGLALACFTKSFGTAFLGHPRSTNAQRSHEAGWTMKVAMVLLAGLCIVVGVACPLFVKLAGQVVSGMTALSPEDTAAELNSASTALTHFVVVSLLAAALSAGVLLLRWHLLRSRSVRHAVTWDCGYARPQARMQYTATSFSQPLTDLFRCILRTRKDIRAPQGVFPAPSTLETETPDLPERYMYQPAFAWISSFLARFRWLQHGRLQVYILYIALTLWILLIWTLM